MSRPYCTRQILVLVPNWLISFRCAVNTVRFLISLLSDSLSFNEYALSRFFLTTLFFVYALIWYFLSHSESSWVTHYLVDCLWMLFDSCCRFSPDGLHGVGNVFIVSFISCVSTKSNVLVVLLPMQTLRGQKTFIVELLCLSPWTRNVLNVKLLLQSPRGQNDLTVKFFIQFFWRRNVLTALFLMLSLRSKTYSLFSSFYSLFGVECFHCQIFYLASTE